MAGGDGSGGCGAGGVAPRAVPRWNWGGDKRAPGDYARGRAPRGVSRRWGRWSAGDADEGRTEARGPWGPEHSLRAGDCARRVSHLCSRAADLGRQCLLRSPDSECTRRCPSGGKKCLQPTRFPGSLRPHAFALSGMILVFLALLLANAVAPANTSQVLSFLAGHPCHSAAQSRSLTCGIADSGLVCTCRIIPPPVRPALFRASARAASRRPGPSAAFEHNQDPPGCRVRERRWLSCNWYVCAANLGHRPTGRAEQPPDPEPRRQHRSRGGRAGAATCAFKAPLPRSLGSGSSRY